MKWNYRDRSLRMSAMAREELDRRERERREYEKKRSAEKAKLDKDPELRQADREFDSRLLTNLFGQTSRHDKLNN